MENALSDLEIVVKRSPTDKIAEFDYRCLKNLSFLIDNLKIENVENKKKWCETSLLEFKKLIEE